MLIMYVQNTQARKNLLRIGRLLQQRDVGRRRTLYQKSTRNEVVWRLFPKSVETPIPSLQQNAHRSESKGVDKRLVSVLVLCGSVSSVVAASERRCDPRCVPGVRKIKGKVAGQHRRPNYTTGT
jgi:hypothetical protein